MANKILISLDSSEGAWLVVEYVAKAFGKTLGVEVTLLHILPSLPPVFWDYGHVICAIKKRNHCKALWPTGEQSKRSSGKVW